MWHSGGIGSKKCLFLTCPIFHFFSFRPYKLPMETRKWGEPTYDHPVEWFSIGAYGKFSRAIPYDFLIWDLFSHPMPALERFLPYGKPMERCSHRFYIGFFHPYVIFSHPWPVTIIGLTPRPFNKVHPNIPMENLSYFP